MKKILTLSSFLSILISSLSAQTGNTGMVTYDPEIIWKCHDDGANNYTSFYEVQVIQVGNPIPFIVGTFDDSGAYTPPATGTISIGSCPDRLGMDYEVYAYPMCDDDAGNLTSFLQVRVVQFDPVSATVTGSPTTNIIANYLSDGSIYNPTGTISWGLCSDPVLPEYELIKKDVCDIDNGVSYTQVTSLEWTTASTAYTIISTTYIDIAGSAATPAGTIVNGLCESVENMVEVEKTGNILEVDDVGAVLGNFESIEIMNVGFGIGQINVGGVFRPLYPGERYYCHENVDWVDNEQYYCKDIGYIATGTIFHITYRSN